MIAEDLDLRVWAALRPIDAVTRLPIDVPVRVGGDGHARTDRAPQILALRRDGVERSGRAEIADDERPPRLASEHLVRSNRIENPVGADFVGVLVENRHPGLARIDNQRITVEVAFDHQPDRAGQRRHWRAIAEVSAARGRDARPRVLLT